MITQIYAQMIVPDLTFYQFRPPFTGNNGSLDKWITSMKGRGGADSIGMDQTTQQHAWLNPLCCQCFENKEDPYSAATELEFSVLMRNSTVEVLTADGVPLKVEAVVFYHVLDPSLWVTSVKNGYQATHTLAHTTPRAALAAHTLTDVLTQRMSFTKRMEMIVAEGEVKAARLLKVTASGLSPVAFHLRYLQSLSSINSSSSIVVLSLTTELLHMLISHDPKLHPEELTSLQEIKWLTETTDIRPINSSPAGPLSLWTDEMISDCFYC